MRWKIFRFKLQYYCTLFDNYLWKLKNINKILISVDAGFIGSNVAELFFKKFSNSKIHIVEKSNYVGNKKFQWIKQI